jgi:hypothetical protein
MRSVEPADALKTTRWQHLTDRWAKGQTPARHRWEVAVIGQGSCYCDSQALRQAGLRGYQLAQAAAGEMETQADRLRLHRQMARQKAHVLSQQNPQLRYVVVLCSGNDSVLGTRVHAVDSIWKQGTKERT